MKENKRWVYGAIVAMIFLISVSVLAYLKLVPTEIKAVPYYDSIGHFVLFGIFGFLVEMALRGKKYKLFRLFFPLGATLVALFATVDEILQIFSRNRTFDLHDLGFGLLGITMSYFLAKKLRDQDVKIV